MFSFSILKKKMLLNKGLVFISAGEPSGDYHASNLVSAILRKKPDLKIYGIAGPLMKQQGVKAVFDSEKLAVMGITDVIAHSHVIFDAYSTVSAFLNESMPGIVILVDYPGLNLRIAKKAHDLGIPVFYYISPKVWAWGSGRIEKIRQYVDHMGLILPFEEAFYRKNGITSTFVGNPLIDAMPAPVKNRRDGEYPDRKVIGLLPGSRKGEISRHLPVMLEAASSIKKEIPGAFFLLSMKDRKYAEDAIALYGLSGAVEVETGDVLPIFERCDMLVAASGTVTLEAAIAGVPTVIIYIMSDLSFSIAKALVKVEFAGLANLIAGRKISPELLQEDANPERIAAEVTRLLKNPQILDKMKSDFQLVRKKLGKPGAAGRATDIVLSILKKEKNLKNENRI